MAEIEDRGLACNCGLREANTALRQRVAELEADRDRLRAGGSPVRELDSGVIDELKAERDAAIREIGRLATRCGRVEGVLLTVRDRLAYLESVWGAEAITRGVIDAIESLSRESDPLSRESESLSRESEA